MPDCPLIPLTRYPRSSPFEVVMLVNNFKYYYRRNIAQSQTRFHVDLVGISIFVVNNSTFAMINIYPETQPSSGKFIQLTVNR